MTGISFLGSEIGRGHPFYSDGVLQALEEEAGASVIRRRTDVFEVSRGLSRAAWESVRRSYRMAGRGGPVADAYHRLRGTVDYNRDSLLLRVLGRDLRTWAGTAGVLLVDHPAVVGALGGRPDVWYIHGELVAPPEAVVHRAARIFVPREEVAGEFVRAGMHPEQVLVTGVCIERGIADGAFERAEARRERLRGDGPLTVGVFSSGAEPLAHVRTMADAVRELAASRHHALVFAQDGGRLQDAVAGTDGVETVVFRNRRQLDDQTARHFSRLDAVISPPHERSNWAVGIGLPFFLVGPDIGPFAPRNRSLLLRSGVAAEIPSADGAAFPELLDRLREGGLLLRMSEMGNSGSFDGFRRAARLLLEELRRRGEVSPA